MTDFFHVVSLWLVTFKSIKPISTARVERPHIVCNEGTERTVGCGYEDMNELSYNC